MVATLEVEEAVSILRRHQQWQSTEPWKSIADHFEALLERVEKLEQKIDNYLADELAE